MRRQTAGAPFLPVDYVFAFPLGSPIRNDVNRAILSHIDTQAWRTLLRDYLGGDR